MAKNLEFILHVGAHRTGTTVIQEALDLNLKKLLTKKIVCLTPPGIGRRKKIGQKKQKTIRSLLGPLGAVNLISQSFYKFFFVAFLKRSLHKLIADTSKSHPVDQIIISEENLLGKAFSSKSLKLYPQLPSRLKGLNFITDGKVKHIHFCVRSYESFIISYYAMSALYYSEVFDFESVRKRWLNFSGGWYQAIKSVAKLFPGATIHVHVFEETTPKNIFRRIASSCDASYSWPKEKINFSPSEEAIRKALSFKLKKEDYEPDQLLIKYKDFKRFDPLNKNEKKRLSLRYKKDLDLIRREGWLYF